MKGTGTQHNPYIIESFDDLLCINGGQDTYYTLGTDIDANDTPYSSGWTPIDLNCSYFDGANHTIRNIIINNTSLSEVKSVFRLSDTQSTAIRRLNFENLYINGGKSTVFSGVNSYPVYLSEMNFSFTATLGITSASGFSLLTAGTKNSFMENSTINCTISTIAITPIFRGDITNCHIKENITFTSNPSSENLITSTNLMNTAVFANIISRNSSSSIRPAAKLANCYFVMPEMQNISTFNTANNISGCCFYDADVAPDTVKFDTMYALSSENCKNPEHLKSIGFLTEGE